MALGWHTRGTGTMLYSVRLELQLGGCDAAVPEAFGDPRSPRRRYRVRADSQPPDASGATPVLYMTWARRDPADAARVQKQLADAYNQIGKERKRWMGLSIWRSP